MNPRYIHSFSGLSLAFFLGLFFMISPPLVVADSVVTNCADDTDFSTKLASGGKITFNCGPNPVTITFSGQKFVGQDTTIDGGGLMTLSGNNQTPLFYITDRTVTLTGLTLANGANTLGNGGAIQQLGGTLTITNCKFFANTSSLSGGAIYSLGVVNITNSEFAFNQALDGGALYPRFVNSDVTITGSNFHDNQATDANQGWGGAMLLWDGPQVTLKNTNVTNNKAVGAGGGIYVFGATSSLNVGNSHIDSNSATGAAGWGGGIYSEGTVTMVDSTLNLNNATNGGAGGGLYNDGIGTAVVLNSTFSNNHAYFAGGGIANYGTLNLTNSTLSGNSASQGGGLLNDQGVATLTYVTVNGNTGDGIWWYTSTPTQTFIVKNTVLADNANGNCHLSSGSMTPIQSAGFNLSTDNSCASFFNQPGDLANTDPKLGTLANNGGPTQTHLPAANSPAVDVIPYAVNGCGTSVIGDQRGVTRPQNGKCDIGAVEYTAASLFLPLILR